MGSPSLFREPLIYIEGAVLKRVLGVEEAQVLLLLLLLVLTRSADLIEIVDGRVFRRACLSVDRISGQRLRLSIHN